MERKALARAISDQVAANRAVADTIAARAALATALGMQRPDFYRIKARETVDSLIAVEGAIAELIDLLTYFALLYPEAHDDDRSRAGYCQCGRWAETCPARLAAEVGETTWEAEDGTVYVLADAGTVPDAPPAEAPEPAEPATEPVG